MAEGWRDHIEPPGASNRQADSRFEYKYPEVGRVTRGKLVNKPVNSGLSYEMSHTFHFLVNPSEISTTYNTDAGIDFTNPDTSSTYMANLPLIAADLITMSFSLLLDRTYEVWSGTIPEGVLHDIAQLERVLGMPDLFIAADPSGGFNELRDSGYARLDPETVRENSSPRFARNRFPGVLVKKPVKAYFGGRLAYSFLGYPASLSIQMMKFTRKMVPVRAGINISLSSWGDNTSGETVPLSRPDDYGSGGSGGGGGTSVTQ